jgi:hypothetical protein
VTSFRRHVAISAAAVAALIAVVAVPAGTANAEWVNDNGNLIVEQQCSGNGRVECHFPRLITCGASGGCNYTLRVGGQRPGGLNVQACASGLCSAAQSGTDAVTAELPGRFPLFVLDFYGVGTGDTSMCASGFTPGDWWLRRVHAGLRAPGACDHADPVGVVCHVATRGAIVFAAAGPQA